MNLSINQTHYITFFTENGDIDSDLMIKNIRTTLELIMCLILKQKQAL